jgi:hypothetical protein
MLFEFVRGNNTQNEQLSEMLMQLKDIYRAKRSSSEHAQLIQEIDDAISRANSQVIKDALEESGLALEEMVELLTSTRDRVIKQSKHRLFSLVKHEHRFKKSMNIPLGFENSPVEKQLEFIKEMMADSIDKGDGELLSHYAESIGRQFITRSPSPVLINHLKSWKDNAKTDSVRLASRTFLQYLERLN